MNHNIDTNCGDNMYIIPLDNNGNPISEYRSDDKIYRLYGPFYTESNEKFYVKEQGQYSSIYRHPGSPVKWTSFPETNEKIYKDNLFNSDKIGYFYTNKKYIRNKSTNTNINFEEYFKPVKTNYDTSSN